MKNKMGRKKKPLEDMVFDGWKKLDSDIIWGTAQYCADNLGISVDSLSRRIKEKTGLTFAEYKTQKKEPMRVSILQKQYQVAMTGNVSMLIWLGKNELGQSDKAEIENNNTEIKLSYNVSTESN